MEFDEKLEKILKKRKNSKKTFSQSLKNTDPTFNDKLNIDEKIQKVQKQKALIYEVKTELRLEALKKKQLREITDKETEILKAIHKFRKFFEEKWTTLILFSKISSILFSAVQKRKIKFFSILLAKMQAYKIQKNFRLRILKGCSITVFNLQKCKNHLKLFLKLSKTITLDQFALRLVKLIKASSRNFEIKKKFLNFSKSAIKIQKAWKKWIYFYTSLFKSFLGFWNDITEELINYYSVKSKENKKKKSQILVKLTSIPSPVKEKCIKNYLKICRKKVKNSQNSSQVYTKDSKLFTRLILESCLEKVKMVKKLPTIVVKKNFLAINPK